jgi:hypothetical protein
MRFFWKGLELTPTSFKAKMQTGDTMKAEELDKIFDEGKEDMPPYLDMTTLRRPNLDQKRVNVDLPIWMIQKLDRQANLIGVTRQSIIKVWLSERIKEEYAEKAD